jgi:hypothetical protein
MRLGPTLEAAFSEVDERLTAWERTRRTQLKASPPRRTSEEHDAKAATAFWKALVDATRTPVTTSVTEDPPPSFLDATELTPRRIGSPPPCVPPQGGFSRMVCTMARLAGTVARKFSCLPRK